jgi:hypothetical protein
MLEIIVGAGDGQGSPKANNYDDFLDDEISIATDNKSMSTRNEAPNFASNVRIISKKYKRETELAEELAPAPDSETGTINLEESEAKVGKTMNAPSISEDANIPTRVAVKKSALRTSQEFTRKQEMEIRRKKLLEVQFTINSEFNTLRNIKTLNVNQNIQKEHIQIQIDTINNKYK